MFTAKVSIVLLALVAGVCLVQAAGGIKGQEQQRISTGIKGPRQQIQQQQQYKGEQAPLPQEPVQQVAIKGPGQIQPIFTAARVQPILPPPPPPVLIQAPIIQAPILQAPIVQQTQEQVQESEIDPNAAAQDNAPAILAPAVAAPAAASEEEANPRPEPYAFNYGFESGDSATAGSSQREESQDASGKVTGFYTLRGEDGRDRRVDYVADANGFRATISTNEMGTAPKDSADVDWQAQSPSDAQLRAADRATAAARARELANPTPLNAINQQTQQQLPLASANNLSKTTIQSPRGKLNAAAAAASTKGTPQFVQQENIAQLQEPFEQIRQTELNGRARKSRHAPFYLFTI